MLRLRELGYLLDEGMQQNSKFPEVGTRSSIMLIWAATFRLPHTLPDAAQNCRHSFQRAPLKFAPAFMKLVAKTQEVELLARDNHSH